MNPISQTYETYLPVYDAVPELWEEARPFFVEQLKKIANEFNIREIGWFLDKELLAGKYLFPGTNPAPEEEGADLYRSVFRKVISFPTIAAGVNTQLHEILVDGNFTLVSLTGALTNATTMTGEPVPNGTDTISYNATQIIITTASAWTRGLAIIEYVQEL